MSAERIDTLVAVETPEGVELLLRAAGPVVRAYAWAIDFTIRLVILGAVAFGIGWLGELGWGLTLLVYFLVEWAYSFVFEGVRGATPGKRVMGLAVVHENGTPVGWSAAFVRNLLRTADFLPVAYGFGLVWCLFHPRFQRLGDLAAGTLVVYTNIGPDRSTIPPETPLNPPMSLEYDDQQALLAFAERFTGLSSARAQELAMILQPMHRRDGDHAVAAVLGYANKIAGR